MDSEQVGKDVLYAYKTVVALGLSLSTYQIHSEDTQTTAKGWITVTNCQSKGIHEGLFKISDIEFISIATKSLDKYNVLTNTWTKIIDFPESWIGFRGAASLDSKFNILYIYGTSGNLLTFNLHTNQAQFIYTTDKIGLGSAALIFDDKFHIIGGMQNGSHLVYNTDTKQFDEIGNVALLAGQKVVCLSSKNVWLLMGGWEPYWNSSRSIYQCEYTKSFNWSHLELELPVDMHSFGCVVLSNEQYAIIFGGQDRRSMMSSNFNTIYVLDTGLMKFFVLQNIRCPDFGRFNALIMNHGIESRGKIVSGFVAFEKVKLSDDILGLIQRFYISEWIYLTQGNEVWKINVDEILDDMTEIE